MGMDKFNGNYVIGNVNRWSVYKLKSRKTQKERQMLQPTHQREMINNELV